MSYIFNIANPKLIFLPALSLMVFTFLVLIWMFKTRVKAVKEKQVEITYFKTYDKNENLPRTMLQAGRNFSNLFEVPTLFYALTVYYYSLNLVTSFSLSLAWAFVLSRVVHSIIHLTSNKIDARMFAYTLGWLIIMAMIFDLGMGILTR